MIAIHIYVCIICIITCVIYTHKGVIYFKTLSFNNSNLHYLQNQIPSSLFNIRAQLFSPPFPPLSSAVTFAPAACGKASFTAAPSVSSSCALATSLSSLSFPFLRCLSNSTHGLQLGRHPHFRHAFQCLSRQEADVCPLSSVAPCVHLDCRISPFHIL